MDDWVRRYRRRPILAVLAVVGGEVLLAGVAVVGWSELLTRIAYLVDHQPETVTVVAVDDVGRRKSMDVRLDDGAVDVVDGLPNPRPAVGDRVVVGVHRGLWVDARTGVCCDSRRWVSWVLAGLAATVAAIWFPRQFAAVARRERRRRGAAANAPAARGHVGRRLLRECQEVLAEEYEREPLRLVVLTCGGIALVVAIILAGLFG